jgi:hypothetical protein
MPRPRSPYERFLDRHGVKLYFGWLAFIFLLGLILHRA